MVSRSKGVCAWETDHSCAQPEEWNCRTLHASREIVPVIEDLVSALDAEGYSAKETFGVRLALEEALVNAIKHGNKGDTSKAVHFRYYLTPECLQAEIEDQGSGFCPEEVPDPFAPENLERPSGRGLLLMRSYMTWVRFNELGNRVTMCRRRTGT